MKKYFIFFVVFYNLDGIKAVQWGRIHEKDALDFLKINLILDVQSSGIWLTNSGSLGANSDGLVEDDAILEAKCPYSYRSEYLTEKLQNSNKYIIFQNNNGKIFINNDHSYYHQIQRN